MRILIDSGSYHCLNVGDMAMMQAGIGRLRELWPTASIAVVTNAPHALARHCPGVRPVPLAGRIAFQTDRWIGRADRWLPARWRNALNAMHDRLRDRRPATLAAIVTAKRMLALRADCLAALAYVRAVKGADLVVATGAGVFTDAFVENASGVLDTLELAVRHRVFAAALGQGIGPLSNPKLRRRMSDVLPRLDLVTLRERRESGRLLHEIGVRADRVVVTGDDALEMAGRAAPPALGDGIGINVRKAPYSGVDRSGIDAVRLAVRRAATRLAAPLVAVPIAHHDDCHDGDAIRRVIDGDDGASPIVSLETPARTISEVSRCRVVVTGSYHAAVFALGQGIPVVGLAATQYYLDKFAGLADLFNGGCRTVAIDSPDAEAVLEQAILDAWADAPERREALLRAAEDQIRRGKEAYRRLGQIVGRGAVDAESSPAVASFSPV